MCELRDFLRLAIVKNLEVFFLQVTYGVSRGIPDDHWHDLRHSLLPSELWGFRGAAGCYRRLRGTEKNPSLEILEQRPGLL